MLIIFLALVSLVLKGQVAAQNGYDQKRTFLDAFLKMVMEKSHLAATESEELLHYDLDMETSVEMVNQLSETFRMVGVGYDIVKGSPDGTFYSGGIDPGIKSTRPIYNFTYNRNKEIYYEGQAVQVPDQVNFRSQHGCSARSEHRGYSGVESYQKSLNLGASPSVSLFNFRFGLSGALQRAKQETEMKNRVFFDQKEICNYGRLEYLNDISGLHTLSKIFQDAVRQLPVQYSYRIYKKFLDKWGTHVIISADIGTKKIIRSSASYAGVNRMYSGGVKAGVVTFTGHGGSLGLDVSHLKINSDSSSKFASRVTSFNIGSRDHPVPISLQLIDISDALRSARYWQKSENYDDLKLEEKRANLARVLKDYAKKLQILNLGDPLVPYFWPDGGYALPAPRQGCPKHWSHGRRIQASGDNVQTSSGFTSRMDASFGDGITLGYCIKHDETSDDVFEWPRGSYCIARSGGDCPEKFVHGSITWNDKKTFVTRKSKNVVLGKLPDGEYDKNTKIKFCCRSDGSPSSSVLLPTDNPFVLYRYMGICQRVKGTSVEEHFVKFDDNSILFSKNECSGAHPDDDDCKKYHKVHYCFYQSSNRV